MGNKAMNIWGTKKCRNYGIRHNYKRKKCYHEGTNQILMRNNVVKIWGTNIQSWNKIVIAKVNKAIVKEQVDSKCGTKLSNGEQKNKWTMEKDIPTNNNANSKEQLESKRGIKQ
jgi:hypothetical protein